MRMFQLVIMIYDRLASYYDELVKDDEATQSWVDWIEEYAHSGSLLELACGSGEITRCLANAFHPISALDLSTSMVEQAQHKDKEHKIKFYCQDMRHLDNLSSYDVICCLCDSFNYLLSQEDVASFFKEVHNHLNKDGLFFFDTHSLDRLDEFSEEFNETGDLEDCQYQWSITSEDDFIYQDFAFYLSDGSLQQEHHLQRVYTPEFLESTLSMYFDIVNIRTDFILDGIQEGEKYFYVCQRRDI